jgi:hypothetical protein
VTLTYHRKPRSAKIYSTKPVDHDLSEALLDLMGALFTDELAGTNLSIPTAY